MPEEPSHIAPPRDEASEQEEAITHVLLLDDDPAISKIIQSCLTRNGYRVTLAATGVAGIREMMENTFGVILCEMTMPGMSGEVFYRTVERLQPELCSRIVFITGHRSDAKTSEFIKSVNAPVLLRPFHPTDLLDAVGFALVCHQFPEGEAPRQAAPLERPPDPPGEAAAARPEEVETAPADGASPPARKFNVIGLPLLAGALLLAVLIALMAYYYTGLQARVEASAAALRDARQQWEKMAGHRPDLTKAWAELQALQNVQGRLKAAQAVPRWMPALRSIATATVPGLRLGSVRARTAPGGEGAFEIEIEGVVTGPQPEASAERFRETVETKLKDLGAGQVSAQFADPGGEEGGERDSPQVAFTLVVRTSAFPEASPNGPETP